MHRYGLRSLSGRSRRLGVAITGGLDAAMPQDVFRARRYSLARAWPLPMRRHPYWSPEETLSECSSNRRLPARA